MSAVPELSPPAPASHCLEGSRAVASQPRALHQGLLARCPCLMYGALSSLPFPECHLTLHTADKRTHTGGWEVRATWGLGLFFTKAAQLLLSS